MSTHFTYSRVVGVGVGLRGEAGQRGDFVGVVEGSGVAAGLLVVVNLAGAPARCAEPTYWAGSVDTIAPAPACFAGRRGPWRGRHAEGGAAE